MQHRKNFLAPIFLLFVFLTFTIIPGRLMIQIHYPEAGQLDHSQFSVSVEPKNCYWQIERKRELGTHAPLEDVAQWYKTKGWEGESGNDQSWNKEIKITNLIWVTQVVLIYTPESSANILTMTRLTVSPPNIVCKRLIIEKSYQIQLL